MRKIIIIFINLLFLLCLMSNQNIFVKAFNIENKASLDNIMNELFGNKEIKNLDYLYDFNDETLFIYLEFVNGGYCIISKDGDTILEYSFNGDGPYKDIEKKYYCGPTYYFRKINSNQYYNNYNNEIYYLSDDILNKLNDELELIEESVNNNYNIETNNIIDAQNMLCNDNESESGSNSDSDIPTLDEEGIINANIPSASEIKYINNYEYFTGNPMHGINSSGTCGAVAAQLMLSYHNYYSDRRIISSNYLNGGWNNSEGDNDIFNPLNYDDPSLNPNVCKNPKTMNWYTLGSTGVNENDDGTYFNYLVKKIPSSAKTDQVKNGIIDALKERNEILSNDINFEIDSHFGTIFDSLSEEDIKEEIDSDKPVIILMQKDLGGWDHYVVAYGYQNIISRQNNKEYSGFITHFGHSSQALPNRINVWINSAWCYSYISMNINHTHNYNIITDNIINNSSIEIRCEECGHRTLDDLYDVNNGSILGIKYKNKIVGDIEIPSYVNNQEINSISENLFANCTNLTTIKLPDTINYIGSNAFEDCTSLKSISLSNNLTSIGDSAFKGCSSLECITIPNTIKNIESNTFENCTSLKIIDLPDFLESIGNLAFKDCIKLENLTTPNTLNSIGTSAFYRCTSLQSVTLSTNLESINDFTFNGCTSLISITIPTSVIRVGSFSFQNCTSLQSVIFSNKLISIESRAFNGCTSLESLTLPDSVKNIESNAFESCTGLLSVVLSNNLESIGSSSFEGCSNLTNIVIPSSVENICIYAFKNCISLQNVNILRNSTEITNLESLVFLGCSNNLEITVPRSVFYIYCKANNWNQYALQIVPDIPFEEISLDCVTKDKNLINNEYDELYKLNVYCTKTYKFTSTDNVSMIIYDASMNEKVSGIDYLECYMSKGTYYLDINSDVDTFSINYGYLYSSTGTQIDICETNSITSLLHESSGNKKHGVFNFYNNDSSGFYKISLKSGTNTLFPKESIKIYTDSAKDEILDRYYDKNIDSITYLNENELYVYLSKYHYYYLDILIYNYSNVTLTIERVETNDIDYLDGLNYTHFDVIFEYKNSISYFEEVNISQRSKIELDIVSSGSINESIPIYVLEKKYDASNSSYYLYTKLFDQITSINRAPIFTLIMDPGTYYFGFHNNTDNVNINFALRRIVDYETNMTGTLVADPAKDQGYALGSEVLFNNGLCDNYTITEGFTRSIYLMVEDRVFDPMSRLEYDWYSNNDDIAKVTEFGTVLAMPVDEDTEVTIFAILKVDPSIVYYKTFTILNDLNEELIEIESEMDYSFSRQNGTYQLELDSNNSPFPMIQYYTWEIINNDDEIVTMDNWGNITSTGETVVEIIGTYNLNPRVKIYITLTILE